jgi:hypothetical protein
MDDKFVQLEEAELAARFLEYSAAKPRPDNMTAMEFLDGLTAHGYSAAVQHAVAYAHLAIAYFGERMRAGGVLKGEVHFSEGQMQ